MIFCKADEQQANEVKHILAIYEGAFGQQINYDNSQVVSARVLCRVEETIF